MNKYNNSQSKLTLITLTLISSLVLTWSYPSLADNSTNSTTSSSTQTISPTVTHATTPATITTNNNQNKSTTVTPVVVEVPYGTNKIIINCSQDNGSNVEPSSTKLKSNLTSPNTTNQSLPTSTDLHNYSLGPVQPNPTMPYYQNHPLPKGAIPVIVTQCPSIVVVQPKPKPKPDLNITVNNTPNLFGNTVVRTYTTYWYPQNVNPSQIGQTYPLKNNQDLHFWPNPTKFPSDVTVYVTGVFTSVDQIEEAGREALPPSKPNVLSDFYEQFSHPQQTLAKLNKVQQQIDSYNKAYNEELRKASSLQEQEHHINSNNVYLISFPQNKPYGLISIGVPVSPANIHGFWPNPKPSQNIIVSTSGYNTNTNTDSLNPYVALINHPLPKVVPDTRTPYPNYERNTGSYGVPSPQAGSTQQPNSVFSDYYVTSQQLNQLLKDINKSANSSISTNVTTSNTSFDQGSVTTNAQPTITVTSNNNSNSNKNKSTTSTSKDGK